MRLAPIGPTLALAPQRFTGNPFTRPAEMTDTSTISKKASALGDMAKGMISCGAFTGFLVATASAAAGIAAPPALLAGATLAGVLGGFLLSRGAD